ncbi:MAG: dihydroorotate dehydrogenase electron transfer subunit [Patescibacteria group bacterium]|jgi:dihydroorotate dehydrogenase electron transfer subunit
MENALGKIEQPISLPIVEIVEETATVKTFFFKKEFDSQPGQFVIMWIPRVDEKPFSVSYDDHGRLGLSIANVGPFTKNLFNKKVGDLVGLRGPYGSWFKLKNNFKRILLVGGGYGVAPLAFLAQRAVKQKITVDFCNGARTKSLLLFKKRLTDYKVNLHISTDDGSDGIKGTVIDATNDCLGKNTYDAVYICGPELMEKKIIDLCAEKNLECRVSIERYMKCGFGICGQCCLDGSGERMCLEGPVVSGKYALKHKEFGAYHRGKSGRKEYYK